MELSWTNLDTVIKDCILDEARDAEILAGVDMTGRSAAIVTLEARGAKVVESAMQLVAFNAERLAAHKDDIASMLSELPAAFKADGGGGMSLMQMPFKGENLEQWGEQWQADLLYALGAGVGLAAFVLPRGHWHLLPGGMPYIKVTL